MDILAILALIEKGVTVAEALWAVGKEAAPALLVVKNVITGAKTGTVTEEQLAETEAVLDDMITDFNLEIA